MIRKAILLFQEIVEEEYITHSQMNEILDIIYFLKTEEKERQDFKNRIEVLKEQKYHLEKKLEQLKEQKQANEINENGIVVPQDLTSSEKE